MITDEVAYQHHREYKIDVENVDIISQEKLDWRRLISIERKDEKYFVVMKLGISCL
jgi:hypothetical protein